MAQTKTSDMKQWGRLTRIVVVTVSLIILILTLYAARRLISPLIIAALLAYVLNPAVAWVEGYAQWSRARAVIPIYLLFLIGLGIIPAVVSPPLIEQGRSLALDLANFDLENVAFLTQIEQRVGVDFALLADPLSQIQQGLLSLFRPDLALSLLQAVLTNLAWVAITLVAVFYFLRDWRYLRNWLISIAPDEAQPEIQRIYEEIKVVWQSYLRGQLSLMLLVGVASAIGGAAVGLPGALLIGVLAGLLDVIPSVGPAIAMIVAIFVAGLEGSTYLPVSNVVFMVIVAAVYMTVQTVENIWWRPKIMGESLKLHPGLVFVAVMGALAFVGPLAALIVVPIIGSVAIIGRTVRARLIESAN
jgi:predicted PurR-regulated permease PerM